MFPTLDKGPSAPILIPAARYRLVRHAFEELVHRYAAADDDACACSSHADVHAEAASPGSGPVGLQGAIAR